MDGITKKDVKDALHEAFADFGITKETHSAHHQFIEMEIQKREQRHEKWNKFQGSMIGGITLAILGFLGWLGSVILDFIQAHWK